MRWSKCFIPTLRESPAGTESVAQKLLVRAGFVRAASTGGFGYLPFGMRSLRPIQLSKRGALEDLQRGRPAFSTAEWKQFLLRSVGFEPSAATL